MEDHIEAVPGVLEVNVMGAREREIILEIDPLRAAAYDLSAVELQALIPSQNVNKSAGGLETPGVKFNVRIQEEFRDPVEMFHLPLVVRNGKTIHLSDVATIRDTFKDRVTYSRLDGRSSITVAVKKRIGANVVHIAEGVKKIIAEFEKQMPAGVTIELTDDQSKEIHMMVSDLENNILTGLILVVAVLVLFMGLRTSVIVALAIPLSMLMSFAILQWMGVTLNMVVLFGLILALGMLVDNAIVIVENIHRHREMGYGRVEAARKGTSEVAWPVIASTATTVAAFGPLLFWPDIMGDFMSYIPLTVITVLSSSLVVAMVISPVVCSFLVQPTGKKEKTRRGSGFLRGYRFLLETALRHPGTTLTLAALTLVAIIVVYSKQGKGVELFPDIDPRQTVINIRAPQGANLDETDRIARLVEERLEKHRLSYGGHKRIDHLLSNIGSAGGFNFFGGGMGGPHVGNIQVLFPDYEDRADPDGRAWKSADLTETFRRAVAGIPGADIKVEKLKEGPPTGAAVTVRFIGEDMEELKKYSEAARKMIEDVPNLVNLRSDLEAEKPELVFEIDRNRASLLGVNPALISETIKTYIFGTKVSTYREFNDEYDIRIRLPLGDRDQIDDVLRLHTPRPDGVPVPLSSVGRLVYRPGLGDIHRIDRKRVVTLTADVEGRLGPEVLKDVQTRLGGFKMDDGYRIEYAGEKEEQDKASAFLGKAFGIALLLIVGILVAQFNTFSAPLIILFTVVLSTAGVFVGLLAFDMPFGVVMTGVGVISLAGVVVNNAIVLLDYTRQLQRRGRDLLDAAVEAGLTRLRPVLLTATTTILGLIPMATGVSFDFHVFAWATRSESSQWWQSMAWAVIFGLTFATILTLVVVPSMYVLFYRIAARHGLGGLQKPENGEGEKPQPVLEDF
jgi:multidrug efflux pump subunit AcrB